MEKAVLNRRRFLKKIGFSLLGVIALSEIYACVPALKVASNCNNVQILSSELAPQDAESYCRYAASERKKVQAFWGATWPKPIRIHVDSSYRISKALLPAYYGSSREAFRGWFT